MLSFELSFADFITSHYMSVPTILQMYNLTVTIIVTLLSEQSRNRKTISITLFVGHVRTQVIVDKLLLIE